ncbi:hypothetical protein [Candidatus Mancarchaeum acidiphilum]|uniref:hypothetical protein n=1 Tax=Candidatus Mancarchaeum acidiphilum TaxID=1920749 RepID=UPI000B597703|nr:hypothetical protein [Candidatus Mancarchaeum acidiphilum]
MSTKRKEIDKNKDAAKMDTSTFDMEMERSRQLLAECSKFDRAIDDPRLVKLDERFQMYYIDYNSDFDPNMLFVESDNPTDIYTAKANTIIKGINILLKSYSEIDKRDRKKAKEISDQLMEYFNRYPAETELVLLGHKRLKVRGVESTAFLIHINKNAKADNMIKLDINKDYQKVFNEVLQLNADGNFDREA